MNQAVHQIRYCWSESSLLGTRGMGPVESTLPPDLLLTWDRYLRDHVWAAGAEPGFTFVVCDGVGALLRKVATADGRPGSAAHALLSPQMTAQEALGLTSWDGWGASALSVLDWPALEPAADRGLGELRARARTTLADRLADLFAQLLIAPAGGYTVIGEPDPLAVTCALGDLIGETPTFASDESADTRPDLPTAVFLREASFSSTTATRRRLSPGNALADAALSSFAVAVVDAYVTDGLDGIAAIRPDRPPANPAEVREWAQAAQFAPGVIADLTRLPKLSPAVLGGLANRQALERVKAAATAAPASHLIHALDRRLPAEVASVLVREAMVRVSSAATDPLLLDRLAELGPLPLDLVAGSLPSGFDHLAQFTQALLAPGDRRVLLERTAENIPIAGLIRWIDEHAAADPDGALAVYSALCRRARKASKEDLRVLVARNALVDAVRQMAESERQSSVYLVTLLRALPKHALEPDVIAELAGHTDPVLLHALDTLVTDQPGREAIHRQVRLAYYHAHHLQEPAALLPEDNPADSKAPSRRRVAFRRPHSNHRKPK